MGRGRSVDVLPGIAPAAAAVVGCGGLAGYGMAITHASGSAVWWPAAGLGVGLAIMTPRRSRVVVAVSAGVADTAVGLAAGHPVVGSLVSGLLAGLLCVLVATAFDRAIPGGRLARQADLTRYVVAVSAPLALVTAASLGWGAVLGTYPSTAVAGVPGGPTALAGTALHHLLAQLVGVLVVATPILLWSARRELAVRVGLAERMGYLLVTAGVTAAVFWPPGSGHLAYLALLPLLAAGVRCEPFWASVCMATAAMVAGTAGELANTGEAGVASRVALLLPTFLAVATLATLVLATAVQQRRRTERELADALADAEASARDFEAFSYAVAHDLRTPLRAIDGFGHALAVDHSRDLAPEALLLLERVRTGARYMGRLVDGLLMLARVSRVQPTAELVDVSRLAQDSIERLRAAEPDRQVLVTVAPGASAAVDLPLFGIVLDNLIGNAWKFTATTPSPKIEFGWRRVDDGTELWVTDNGMGFDMDYSDKLFKPFQRLHADTEVTGAGLGLATTATIVDRHGGIIRAAGEVGKGATFTVVLPSPREALEE